MDGRLRDFCDGQDFHDHELFGDEEMSGNALIIHGYYDEFQVTNPLGSRTRNHKLGNSDFSCFSILMLSKLERHYLAAMILCTTFSEPPI